MMRTFFASLLVFCSAVTTASAQAEATRADNRGALRVAFGGGYQSSSEHFSNEITFPRDLETALVRTDYAVADGPLVDLGASFGLGKGLALQGGVSVFSRSTAGATAAAIPHPFFFNQPRGAELDIATSHRETITRLEVAWSFPLVSRLRVGVSGGAAFAHVDQEFVVDVDVTDAFPFSSVTVGPVTQDRTGSALGGTAAVDLEWQFARRVGVGLSGRYTRARVELEETDIHAGGTAVIGTVRIRLK